MKQYLDLMRDVIQNGTRKDDRTGTGTVSVFGRQMRFNLQEGFPLVTTKKIHLKSVIHELLWFLSGSTNIQYLKDNGVSIWDSWANEDGELGPVYGSQWRKWPTYEEIVISNNDGGIIEEISVIHKSSIDQIQQVIGTLKNNPDSRRIIVSAWNVAEINDMKLPPCHALFQFYTENLSVEQRWYLLFPDGETHPTFETDEDINKMADDAGIPARKLSCQLYQRSADVFLGVPFNIASYALLTMMVAQVTNMVPGEFIWTGGDTHLYTNHLEQANLQLSREPHPMPQLIIKRKPESIFDYKYEDFEISNYQHHPAIKAPVAV